MKPPWDIPAAISLYNIDRWGSGYFTINEKGNIQVLPTRNASAKIDMMDVIEDAKARGLNFPLVLRFQDLLRDRVETINKAFASAIAESGFKNSYRGVFPIKVNQLREVVEEITDAGSPFHFGLEAGSKPELIAARNSSLSTCTRWRSKSWKRSSRGKVRPRSRASSITDIMSSAGPWSCTGRTVMLPASFTPK